MLTFFDREVIGCGVDQRLLTLWLAVVGEGIVEVEPEGAWLACHASENSLGLAKLVVGKKRGGGAKAGLELGGLDLKGGHFGGGFFAGLEVFTDADAGEPAGDSP